MRYLDESKLARLDGAAFRSQMPFPWINPQGLVTDLSFRQLVDTLPQPALFERQFSETRRYGQKSHDRLVLDYRPDLPIADAWHEFIAELSGAGYRAFLKGMFARKSLRLRFHWHYTPNGCSVSPHCDARRKLGSHIFYFNTEDDWRPEWGGETLILDDDGRFSTRSAPSFEDFARLTAAQTMGNRSLLFMRREQSWHGVKPIACPPGALRKVFVVVIDDWRLKWRAVNFIRGHTRPY